MAGGSKWRWWIGPVACLVATAAVNPGPAAGETGGPLWVDIGAASCSDAYTRQEAASAQTPWCSVVRAAAVAVAGDSVRIRPGIYIGTVRPASSGTPDAPVRYVALEQGVTLDAGGASAAVKLVSVSDIVLEGMAVVGATVQGVWAFGAERIVLDGLAVNGNGGPGVQIRESSAVTVSRSRITGNGGAGIFETSGSAGNRYVSNEITANGLNGDPYNGDGMQIAGTATYIAGNTIVGNGDAGPYEHGIYTAAVATDFLIENNVVSANAGSNIKAAGSNGVVRYNRLEGGRLGLVVSDNGTPLTASYNLVFGPYQHGVFVTTGTAPARARLWNNTIVVTSRNAPSGDASAIFVKAADSLDLRNNLVSYANPDNAGSALYVLDAQQLRGFTSDNNWYSTLEPNGRHLVWNGARVNMTKWRRNGQDGKSVVSSPARFDADMHVLSTNHGRRRGQSLGLPRDYVGVPVPIGVAPDIGAYQGS